MQLLSYVCVLARAANGLIHELDIKFPTHFIMDALGIMYPQYWLQANCDMSFGKHLEVLKGVFCYGTV
jgi:hypothetical protein